MAEETGRNPEGNLSRLRFVHHEIHIEWPRCEIGTPPVEGLISGEYSWCSRISHCQRRKRSVTTAAVWVLALSWRMMGFCTTKCRRFLLSPCDYDLFAKVKEPLRGTRYNTWDELIRVIGLSIRNVKEDGRADCLPGLPNICQKVINKGTTILKVHKCCTPVNLAMSEILNSY